MKVLKYWLTSLLLVLTPLMAQASDPLMTLVLPNGRQVAYDEATLAALPQAEFETATPWTAGKHRYRGPTLAAMLAVNGASNAQHLLVTGVNGYQQRVALSLFEGVPLVLARYEDDKPMTRRNKGPLWLLTALSDNPKIDVEPVHNCMVWQVVRIEVID